MSEYEELHRAIVELAVDAIITIDASGTIRSFNRAAEAMLGYRAAEVLGENVRTLMAEPFRSAHDAYIARYVATGEPHVIGSGREVEALRKDGTTLPVRIAVGEVRVGERRLFTAILHDVTAARQAANEHAALRNVAETIARGASTAAVFALVADELRRLLQVDFGGVVRFDEPDLGTVMASSSSAGHQSSAAGARMKLRRKSLLWQVRAAGLAGRTVAGSGDVPAPWSRGQVAAPVRVGDRVWGAVVVANHDRAGAPPAAAEERSARFADLLAVAVVHAEAAQQLRLRTAQQAVVSRLGRDALIGADLAVLMDDAVTTVAATLGVELAKLLELAADGRDFVVRAGTGWRDGVVGRARIPVYPETQVGYTLGVDAAVVVGDMEQEPRFRGSRLLHEHGVRSGMTVVVRVQGGPWGVLGAHSTRSRAFSDDDADFLAAVANILGAAIERRRVEDALTHHALHDSLTGAPNRTLLMDRLAKALQRAARSERSVALICIDLDHFKVMNDTLGHGAGDELLVGVAERLAASIRPSDTLARLGGDEFVVLCDDVAGPRDVLLIGERVRECFAQPFRAGDEEVRLTASLGVAIGGSASTAAATLRDAATAVHRAKAGGRDRYELFDDSMRASLLERRGTEADLRRALAGDQLALHYQPIVSLGDGRIDGFEALVRWDRPNHGLVGPSAFIPLAEETGLIVPLGRWVIAQACADGARWNALRPDRRPLDIHVNLSARQLADATLVDHVETALAGCGLAPARLALEITESALLEDSPTHRERLSELKELGVRLVLDDFGTGYASLGYLRRIPIDTLKLDRSFVAGLGSSARDTAIVTAVARMAHALELDVVAEGIETLPQLVALQALGCERAQGFYFARPVGRDAADAFLDEPPWLAGRRWPRSAP